MRYKVWWIPQVPMEPFEVEIATLGEAKLLTRVLAEYDRFQYEHRVKPDYCNAGGIMVWENDPDGFEGWTDLDEDDE